MTATRADTRKHRRRHGLRWHDRHTISAVSLEHGIKFKSGEHKGEFRIQPQDATVLREERKQKDGVTLSQLGRVNGDVRPNGCDIISHGTERDAAAPGTRLVLTLRADPKTGGFSDAKARLKRAKRVHGFRMTDAEPVEDICGRLAPCYTLTGLTPQAIAFLLTRQGSYGWIDTIQETTVKLEGNGAIDHIARKPKRKRSSYHPDYIDWRNGFLREKKAAKPRSIVQG